MLNIGQYVFSRAKQENYRNAGNFDIVTQQALRALRKSTKARDIDAGEMPSEIMAYAVMEEKLNAHKLLSKIELSADTAQCASETDGIHSTLSRRSTRTLSTVHPSECSSRR